MIKFIIHRISGIVFVLLLINGCATTTHIREWSSSDEFDRNFKKILIMGLVNNVSLRNDIEGEVIHAARKYNMKSINSMSMFPPELGKPFDDTERVRTRLQESEFDGILTIALIDVTAERYIRPERKYVPLVYYNRFGNYYYRTYAQVYKKGYFALESKYFLETNLYELKNGSLLWSGRSFAFDPHDVEKFVPAYAKRLFKELLEKGVIAR
jgi:hypothetical protein